MTLKILHLNIFQGKFLPLIVDYVKEHDFDILQFQEVSGGSMSKGGVWSGPRALHTEANPETVGIDCFTVLKEELGFQGILNTTIAKRDDHASYIGNATFFRSSLSLQKTQEIFLKPYAEVMDRPIPPHEAPRAALMTTFSLQGKDVSFINCHLAWGPTDEDEPYKVDQGKILYEYIKSLTNPFVVTGDFNVNRNSEIVRLMGTLGRNLVTEKNITNTLNPNVHAAKHLFPSGIGVDFAFVSKELEVTDFQLVDTPDLSDHLGLALTLEL